MRRRTAFPRSSMAISSKGTVVTNAHRSYFGDDSIHEGSLLSAGFRVGNLIYISGQVVVKENRGIVGVGDFVAQTHQELANIRKILEVGGSSLANVVDTTPYATEIETARKDWLGLKKQYFSFSYAAGTFVDSETIA